MRQGAVPPSDNRVTWISGGLEAIIGRLFYHHTDILFVSFSK